MGIIVHVVTCFYDGVPRIPIVVFQIFHRARHWLQGILHKFCIDHSREKLAVHALELVITVKSNTSTHISGECRKQKGWKLVEGGSNDSKGLTVWLFGILRQPWAIHQQKVCILRRAN